MATIGSTLVRPVDAVIVKGEILPWLSDSVVPLSRYALSGYFV